MPIKSQTRAVNNYRKRLKDHGMARFEVLAPSADRDLIRALARRLAKNGEDAGRLRLSLRQAVSDEATKKGGILRALRLSPLVGADIDMSRAPWSGRKVEF
ncbi:MAG TPA: hypothetical protein VMU80_21420 [Bryobacteraceae bacterium]|nr:hypothetical protein [Bryobacteraceae bacterium]